MSEPTSRNTASATYYLVNAAGLLLRRSGGWTTDRNEAKAFQPEDITPQRIEVAELFGLTVIKVSANGDDERLQMYAVNPEEPVIDILKRRGSQPRFCLAGFAEQLPDELIRREEVEAHIQSLKLALALANLLS